MDRKWIVALAAMCLVVGWLAGGGSVEAQSVETQTEPCPDVPEIGRFEFREFNGGILVDTATGDTWEIDCDGETGSFGSCDGDRYWKPRERR